MLPEFQHRAVGDAIRFGANEMRVEPEHVLAWRSQDGRWVWTFVLQSDGRTTRLVSRNRYRFATVAARLAMLPMEPGSLVMERKLLRGSGCGPSGLRSDGHATPLGTRSAA